MTILSGLPPRHLQVFSVQSVGRCCIVIGLTALNLSEVIPLCFFFNYLIA